MFRTLEMFTDLEDNGHKYNVGDVYPRKGYTPTSERINSLSGTANKRKRAIISEITEENSEEERPTKKSERKTNKE